MLTVGKKLSDETFESNKINSMKVSVRRRVYLGLALILNAFEIAVAYMESRSA